MFYFFLPSMFIYTFQWFSEAVLHKKRKRAKIWLSDSKGNLIDSLSSHQSSSFLFLHSVTSIQVFHKYEENDRFILEIISVLKERVFFSLFPFSSRKRRLCSLLTKREGLSSPLEEKGLIFSLKHLSCVFTLKSRCYLRWAKCRGQATVASSGNTSRRNVHAKHFYIISTSDDQFTQTLLSCHWQ